MVRKSLAVVLTGTLALTGCGTTSLPPLNAPVVTPAVTPTTSSAAIKHVVVIFGENISFDHYFGSYPVASNLAGETKFTAATGTPTNINNYITNPTLLTANPNLNAKNASTTLNSVPANPFRLAPGQAGTADQDHNYGPEQTAFDNGNMDLFPLSVGTADAAALATETNATGIAATTALTMGYYDGNTVTGLWNYAQHYAMNDHSFGSTFGPSTPGALNVVSGQTNGVINPTNVASSIVADGQGGYTDINDGDPTGDVCSSTSANFSMSGANVGNLLTNAGVTWGMFSGGFNLSATNANGTTGCARTTGAVSIPGNPLKADYIPHHEPFQYYASTANLNHVRPTSVAAIGTNADAANHQYDVADFTAALAAGNLPAVSYIKAPGYQDAHAGYSDPLDEQTFLVNTINAIEQSSFWSSTAIILAYDDSDGWYDHLADVINGSATAADSLSGTGVCLSAAAAKVALPGPNSNGLPVQGRCGHGPRLPLLVISPWAQNNYVDNTVTDQASVVRFIEDTFLASKRLGGGSFDATAGTLNNMFNFTNGAVVPNATPVILNATTGACVSGC